MELSLQFDASGTTPMIQTPLYVGLSVELADRLPKHDPTKGLNSVLASSNKPFALVVSLMKFQGQEPLTKALCVLRVWEKRDLLFAETLVSALARSMICQDGFNRTECGDAGKASGLKQHKDGEDYVKYRSRFFYDNCKAVLQDLRARQSHLSDVCELQPVQSGWLVSSTEQLLKGCEILEGRMQECEAGLEEMQGKAEEVQALNYEWEDESKTQDLIDSWVNL